MRYVTAVLLIVLTTTGLGQRRQLPQALSFSSTQGTWLVKPIREAILQVQFVPTHPWKNDQWSDAVVLQPQALRNNSWKTSTTTTGALEIVHDSLSAALQLRALLDSASAGFTVLLQPNEAIYGGGERAIALNRRGAAFPLYNSPWYGYEEGANALNYSVPFFMSSRGYGIFFDNPSRGHTDIGHTNNNLWNTSFSSGSLTAYIIVGENMDLQLQAYTDLTGRQPLPPRWALGHFMSRFGYSSQEQVTSLVTQTREAGFPLDAVVFDLFWFGDSIKGTMGNLDWVNSKRWPDPAGMINNLKQQQIKSVLITEPFVLEGTRQYEAAKPFFATDSTGKPFRLTDFYFGYGSLLDIFREDAGNWFWTQYDRQIKNGVAGWWGDLGEPEKHPSNLYHQLKKGKLVSADAVHNLYGHQWSKLLYQKYRQHHPDTRLFFLNRAGFAGTQRYSIFPWTGDVARTWSGLRAQLPLLQGMSVSGIPYIHSDAGGFAGGKMDPELYTRWIQFAAFTPVFRPHGTMLQEMDPSAISIPSEPVLWPDSTQNIVRKFIQLRYDFLPYNYSLAFEQTLYGKPLIRPMNYYSFADSNLNKATHQYMWGDQVLVAPVTEQQATTKKLYLPDGDWYNYFTERRHAGGSWIDFPVSIERIPVFVKAGSFIPERTGLTNTEEYKTKFLVIKHYLGKDPGQYVFFDDDGHDPRAIEENQFDIIGFVSQPSVKELKIGVGGADRKYKGRAIKKLVALDIIGFSGRPSAVKLNNLNLPFQGPYELDAPFIGELATWDPINQTLRIVFEYTQRPHKLEIKY